MSAAASVWTPSTSGQIAVVLGDVADHLEAARPGSRSVALTFHAALTEAAPGGALRGAALRTVHRQLGATVGLWIHAGHTVDELVAALRGVA